ncbi:MAG: class I SAM-dependent methyltransferase [Planctomycetota bacterium]|jgi:SAM-dependent methyltransferase
MTTETRKNYQWWQDAGWEWYSELVRRRHEDPTYARQEAYLKQLFEDSAARWVQQKGRPLKVLEYGCGFGRHLKYLHQIEGIEVYGCDQSPSMLSVAKVLLLGRFPELEERLTLIEPDQRLPYEDGFFDVAFTVSVLIHVAPADLAGRVAELRRVADGMLLNVEFPPAPHSVLWDEVHEGCWLHNIVGAHQAVGPCSIEVDADTLAPAEAIYRVDPGSDDHSVKMLFRGEWAEEPEQLRRSTVDSMLEFAKYCRSRAQESFWRESNMSRVLGAANTEYRQDNAEYRRVNAELRASVRDLQGEVRGLNAQVAFFRHRYTALESTRAVRAAYWLARHRRLRRVLKAGFDVVSGFRSGLLRLLGLRRESGELPAPPSQGAGVGGSAAGAAEDRAARGPTEGAEETHQSQ